MIRPRAARDHHRKRSRSFVADRMRRAEQPHIGRRNVVTLSANTRYISLRGGALMIRQPGTPTTHRARRPVAWFVAALILAAASAPRAVSPAIVISQVYGGGNNSGAPYQNDFVVLFNLSTAPASLDGWSIQYTSTTGTGNFSANGITALTGTLAPGQSYLVRLAGGTTNGVAPTGRRRLGHHQHGRRRRQGGAGQHHRGSGLQWGNDALQHGAAGPDRGPGRLGRREFLRDGTRARRLQHNRRPSGPAAAVATPTTTVWTSWSAVPVPRNTASPVSPCGVSDSPPSISSTVPSSGAAQVALAA